MCVGVWMVYQCLSIRVHSVLMRAVFILKDHFVGEAVRVGACDAAGVQAPPKSVPRAHHHHQGRAGGRRRCPLCKRITPPASRYLGVTAS